MSTSEHLSTQYDADLRALRSRVMDMGMTVDEQFRLAIEALNAVVGGEMEEVGRAAGREKECMRV